MIWVLGGNKETYKLVQCLNKAGVSYKLTTMTEYNRDMPLSYTSAVLTKPLNETEMITFIKEENISLIIDNSYEQAITISRTARIAAKSCEVDYIRYLEEKKEIFKGCNTCIYEDLSNEQIAQLVHEIRKTTWLHVNRKQLKDLLPLLGMIPCLVDLPMSKTVLELCQNYGYDEEQIIGKEVTLDKKIIKKYNIGIVIAKEDEYLREYVDLCESTGIPLVVIRRQFGEVFRKIGELDTLASIISLKG